MSQPSPGKAAAPATRRFLVPVGIAAAIALIAGGAWFVVADDSGESDDQVVASTDSQADARAPVWMFRVAHTEGKRWISVEKNCTVVSVDRVPKLVAR